MIGRRILNWMLTDRAELVFSDVLYEHGQEFIFRLGFWNMPNRTTVNFIWCLYTLKHQISREHAFNRKYNLRCTIKAMIQ